MFRDGVSAIIDKHEETTMIWSASNGVEAIENVSNQLPDILLMDISIGFESGVTLSKKLLELYPKLNIIALTMHHEENYVIKVLEIGAKGYLLKDAGSEEMVDAIMQVASGENYYSKHVSQILVKHITRGSKMKNKSNSIQLTNRETEILTLIAQEYSNPEIAKELFISIRTVDTHRRNLLDKLQVKNTAGLVKHAIKTGLLDI